MKKVLVIGANSILAKRIIIKGLDQFKFIAATTSNFDRNLNIEWINIKETYDELKKKLNDVNIVLNFAWSRLNNQSNVKLTNFLLENKNKDCDLIFISSLSASPNSHSEYSKNKYAISKLVNEKEETNIMLGLVNIKNSAQIKLIIKLLKFFPFSVRFTYNFFNVYLIDVTNFEKKILNFLNTQTKSKNFSMYDKLLGSNEFIEFIETEYNLKKKSKVIFPVILIKFILFICIKFPFKFKMIDKLLTFFIKDEKWIQSLNRL